NTTHWYLPLNEYEAWLREWLLDGKKDVLKANVFGQCRSWLEQGLQPRAMTRDLDWGVKVPLPEAEGKVLYVWLDAPIGYISATKAWAEQTGKNWEDYWKKDDTRLIHFIGKDNIVFHCIIFPIMLKAHGEFVLPDNIPANEFLNLEGDKISTSRNWAVWLHEYLEDFPNLQDTLRYVLTSIAPETKDSEFTWKDFQARHNSELADILGNFVNRVIVLTNKYFGGAVPALGELSVYDKEVLAEIASYPQKIEALLENFKFRDAQTELMNLARLGNKYFTVTEPWKLAGNPDNLELVGTILNVTLQIAANLAILAKPFLPFTAEKIQQLLGNGAVDTTLAAHVPQDTDLFVWKNAGKTDILKSYHKIAEKPEVLFPKIEDATIAKQLAKLEASKLARKPAEPLKENMSYDDFTKLDLRIATITAAEKVAKAKKLLKLTLDTGLDIRTVVSGIAEYYEPEKIIGQQVVLLANLAPKEIKGILSQGMILMAEDKDGSLKFVQPSAVVGNGCTVR
ncbi:MAG: methionine--tRNA ligase subunit beta, partial [Thermoflexibacteraceae bacterium]